MLDEPVTAPNSRADHPAGRSGDRVAAMHDLVGQVADEVYDLRNGLTAALISQSHSALEVRALATASAVLPVLHLARQALVGRETDAATWQARVDDAVGRISRAHRDELASALDARDGEAWHELLALVRQRVVPFGPMIDPRSLAAALGISPERIGDEDGPTSAELLTEVRKLAGAPRRAEPYLFGQLQAVLRPLGDSITEPTTSPGTIVEWVRDLVAHRLDGQHVAELRDVLGLDDDPALWPDLLDKVRGLSDRAWGTARYVDLVDRLAVALGLTKEGEPVPPSLRTDGAVSVMVDTVRELAGQPVADSQTAHALADALGVLDGTDGETWSASAWPGLLAEVRDLVRERVAADQAETRTRQRLTAALGLAGELPAEQAEWRPMRSLGELVDLACRRLVTDGRGQLDQLRPDQITDAQISYDGNGRYTVSITTPNADLASWLHGTAGAAPLFTPAPARADQVAPHPTDDHPTDDHPTTTEEPR